VAKADDEFFLAAGAAGALPTRAASERAAFPWSALAFALGVPLAGEALATALGEDEGLCLAALAFALAFALALRGLFCSFESVLPPNDSRTTVCTAG
jgi:hypothetical protein